MGKEGVPLSLLKYKGSVLVSITNAFYGFSYEPVNLFSGNRPSVRVQFLSFVSVQPANILSNRQEVGEVAYQIFK